MPIEKLELFRLDIPFKLSFRHSSAERSRTQSVWVEATVDGKIGRGEGCPREYVTGESLSSAAEFFGRYCDGLGAIHDLPELVSWERAHSDAIDDHPAAWCAIELAILEAFALKDDVAVEELLKLPAVSGEFRYTAVVGDSGLDAFRAMVTRYRETGFTDFKLKLSGDVSKDREKIAALRELSIPKLTLRVDANNLWKTPQEAAAHLSKLDISLVGIEEPLVAGDLSGLRTLAERTGKRIILDESLLKESQLSLLADDPHRWIVNVRVSKMGGVLRCLALARTAATLGIDLIVGAQVGETSLLTRAALVVARAAGDRLLAQEGAFGTLLLESDLTEPPLMFGAGGRLDADRYGLARKPGWGLSFSADRSRIHSF